MKITIICVGKIKEKYWNMAIDEYSKRLSRYVKLEITEVPDEATPDKASAEEEEKIRQKEAERIISKIPERSHVISMEINGKEYDSVGLSKHIDSLGISGKSHIVFIIGGSLGLHSEVSKKAHEKLSFSRLTFPHQLIRVILLEQIYRAYRIMNNEPYHK